MLTNRAPEHIIFGGLASGKTGCIPRGAYAECVKWRDNLGCIATTSSNQIERAIIEPTHKWLNATRIPYQHAQQKQRVTLPNGNGWVYQSLHVPWTELKGPEYGFVFIDEGDRLDQQRYETMVGRARLPETGKIARTFANPPPAGHWLEELAKSGRVQVTTISTYENPFAARDVIQRYERMYPVGTPRHARWMLGKIGVPLEGAVYAEFDLDLHVVERVPEFIGYIGGLDFGYKNPTAFLLAGVTSDDAIYVIGEYYASERLISQHAEDIKAMLSPFGGSERVPIFRDHDAQDAAEYANCGLRTIPAPMGKSIAQGIEMVRERLVDSKAFIQKGVAPNLVREIGQYVWASGTVARDGKDEPIAKNNHAVDAWRYMVTGFDNAALSSMISPDIFR